MSKIVILCLLVLPLYIFASNLNWFYNSDFSDFSFDNFDFWSKMSNAQYTSAAGNAIYFTNGQRKSSKSLSDEFNLAKGVILFHMGEYPSSLKFLSKVKNKSFEFLKNVYMYEDHVYLAEKVAIKEAKILIPEVVNNMNSIFSHPDKYSAWMVAEASNIFLLQKDYEKADFLSLKAYKKANNEDDVSFLDIYVHQRMNVLLNADKNSSIADFIIFLDSYLTSREIQSVNTLNFDIDTTVTEPALIITLTKLYLSYLKNDVLNTTNKDNDKIVSYINSLLSLDNVSYLNVANNMSIGLNLLLFQKYYSELKQIQGKMDHKVQAVHVGG